MYRTYGLLHERAYFAHCCHCGTDEQQLLKLHDAGYDRRAPSPHRHSRAQA